MKRILTLVILLLALSNPLHAIGPQHSGSWYWSAQSGHGFSIEVGKLPDGTPFVAVYWYTYDIWGNPIFLLGTGVPDGDILDVVFDSPVGMKFGEFDPDSVTRQDGGTARLVFTDENNATFQYTPSAFSIGNWGHSSISFMPLTKLFGIEVSEDVTALQARIDVLENLLQGVSRLIDPNTGFDTIRFSGVNVQVVNGTGTTAWGAGESTGTGNLIIGYNEPRLGDEGLPCTPIILFPPGMDSCNRRYGSHMLVVGTKNNYTSYGGMAVGLANETDAPYASISGGTGNYASGDWSSISGGFFNIASGDASSVSGGSENTASGDVSSVSGGSLNVASGIVSSISGGGLNAASGAGSSVSGGGENIASGGAASVSGGSLNVASGIVSSISGGGFNAASGDSSSVSGGAENIASGDAASVSGGVENIASGVAASVSGGRANTASGRVASVSGGDSNIAEGESASVSGGTNMTAAAARCTVADNYTDC